MAKGAQPIVAFNRGRISPLALGRIDLKRMAFSADTQTNWIPRVLGSMMLRPGFGYLGQMAGRPKMLPFVFSTDDTALVEITNLQMRVWIGDTLVSRTSVATSVANGSFTTDVSSWTDNDEAGATSDWDAGNLRLLGTGTAAAIRDQLVSVATNDIGREHALRIVVERGPVTLRVGNTVSTDNYVRETELGTGIHSLAFTPTASSFNIRFLSRLDRYILVASCAIEGPGAMTITAPWLTGDLRRIRFDQSGDVLFVACKGYQQRRIERRARGSWSIVLYQPEDGPFRVENTGPITITPSGLTGNVTLTASAALFRTQHVGALFRMTSTGQRVTASLTAENTFSNEIQVTGVGEARRFTITVSGTFSATVTLQRSVGVTGLWEDVAAYVVGSETLEDGLDNQIVFYRIGIKTGDYVSGTAVLTLDYHLGGITGVARVTAYTSSTVVSAEVLSDLGDTDATDVWAEGAWSDYRGWPTAVAFYEGRLWWAGKNGYWGSISDAFDSFDSDFEGDAGPISRTIGGGPVDDIHWLLAVRRLLTGTEGSELAVRSSALDEPITPTNFNLKDVSTQGSADVAAVKIDTRAAFVQRSGRRVYELSYSADVADYAIEDLTALVPEIGSPGIVAMAVQRQPDTRIHCLRSDGTVGLAVIDRVEKVLSWQDIETDGEIQDIAVLPGDEEDAVYYVVKRELGASGVIALTITNAGSGYTAPPELQISGGGGSNAAATVTLKLVGLAVSAAGSGYVAGEIITLSGGTFDTVATATVGTVGGSGEVLTIAINAAGSYSDIPANSVETTASAAGTGLTLTATWGLGTATIISNGGSYETAPTVSVVGGGGTGGAISSTVAAASLEGYYLEKWALESECIGGTLNKQADSFIVSRGSTTVVAGGFVSSLNVVDGAGYEFPPTLSFSGGGGSGAAATISLTYVGNPIFGNIAGFGSGYSLGDVLTLVGGTFTRPARFQVAETFGSGLILNVLLIDGGSYSVLPPGDFDAVTGGTGSGALIWDYAIYWGLGEATITNPGSGYSSAPTVTLSVTDAPLPGSVSASINALTSTVPATGVAIGGLNHLEGREVIAWADGQDQSPDDDDGVQRTYTVTGGQIVLDTAVSNAVIGLPYEAQWKSAKLAYVTEEGGSALCQRKKISQLGLILANAHCKGLKFGPTFDDMDEMPDLENDVSVGGGHVWEHFDKDMIEFPGEWDTDARLCLLGKAPRPVTLLAAVVAVEEHGKD